ncbi:MarR family transcriptional regulator [Halorhabdus sp. CBA1104]|uniref:MarR family transcriptional regulator n=1 Tax=Halorhabdus sp. CBA1104 TaxID=1380432 RepID=UPI0012B307E1|nr:MarR family transcriptional regulator [Halorhabdus sp. CBA1104]QGN06154.1 MarR family transcriptional regulator [Halorhabdus sp. CBA1104]
MTQADDRLLETLEDSGLILSPRVLAVNTNYSRHYVSERLAVLIEGGLVEKEKEGIYRITEKGKQYLVGDLDTDELQLEQK